MIGWIRVQAGYMTVIRKAQRKAPETSKPHCNTKIRTSPEGPSKWTAFPVTTS